MPDNSTPPTSPTPPVRPVQIVECPRDAMQGFEKFIPTETKVRYLNLLLKVGFHTLDFGSFVSPKAIPHLCDTAEVLEQLDLTETQTQLLAIVANERGVRDALSHQQIAFLGYPFSISETFQQRNTNRSVSDSFKLVQEMQQACHEAKRRLVVYLSMGFGNPYGDPWSPERLADAAHQMAEAGIGILSLADTVGTAQPSDIEAAFRKLVPERLDVLFGAHLHATHDGWRPKVEAAWSGGCRRFDGAMQGFGGCPFAEDVLVGNLATERLVAYLQEKQALPKMDLQAFQAALQTASKVFA